MKSAFLFALLTFLACGLALAQDTPALNLPTAEEINERMKTIPDQSANPIAPLQAELEFLSEDGKKAMQESLEAYYRYRESAFEHRRSVFDWQHVSTKIIFFMVIFLVLLGVYFSWLQFMKGTKEATSDQPITTIEANLKGIKVSSPVLGVIILVISLVFFYLYLVHIYPVVDTF